MASPCSMITLWCGVFGVGSHFPMTVAHDALVLDLQQAILVDQRYDTRHNIPAGELTLYVARDIDHGDQWFKCDEQLDRVLQARRAGPAFAGRRMRSLRKLSTYELDATTLGASPLGAIHALVELPSEFEVHIEASVVQLSCNSIYAGAAVIWGRSSSSLRLLTSLNMWKHEAFVGHVSRKFRSEVQVKLNADKADGPWIEIDQVRADLNVERIAVVRLCSAVCLASSREWNYAILQIPVNSKKLNRLWIKPCEIPNVVRPGMLTTVKNGRFGVSFEAAPGLSGNADVVTTRGAVGGWIDGGLDGAADGPTSFEPPHAVEIFVVPTAETLL